MAQTERILKREDGTEARILILDFPSPFRASRDFEVCIFSRSSDKENWNRVFDTPERRERAKSMGVDEFLAHGRNPIFSVVTPAEILSAVSSTRG